jgi:predicted RNase H-like HicB family nuclease
MINRIHNTKEAGTVEFLVYKEADIYVGVCLTFDIVEEGEDPVTVMKSIEEAAKLHLNTVVNNNMSDDLLNRYAPNEYWEKYFAASENIKEPSSIANSFPVVSPYVRNDGVLV